MADDNKNKNDDDADSVESTEIKDDTTNNDGEPFDERNNVNDTDENWSDILPPPGDNTDSSPATKDKAVMSAGIGDDADDDEAVEEIELDEKGATVPMATATTTAAAGKSNSSPLNRLDLALQTGITKEEWPLLGYAIASFVFFLASLSKGEKTQVSISTVTINTDAVTINTNVGQVDLGDPASSLLNLGLLPQAQFGYAISLGILGMLMAGGVVGWMRYNALVAKEREENANNNAGSGGDVEEGSSSQQQQQQEQDREQAQTQTQSQTELVHSKSKSELLLEKSRWWINAVLFVWAIIGWGFFTFGGNNVFAFTGNGYFALWAMLIFAFINYGVTREKFVNECHNADSCVYGLTIVSIIMLIELSTYTSTDTPAGSWRTRNDMGIATYTLVVSILTILYGLLTAGIARLTSDNVRLDPKIRLGFMFVFVILWILAACLTTFIGPFLTTGNGYFAAWGAVVCTVAAFVDTKREVESLYI